MESEVKTKYARLALLVFPAVVGVTGIVYILLISPIYKGGLFYDYDPVYVYLLNGLSILDGNAPDHIDHPGTPLQVLVAMVVLVKWLFTGINPDMVVDAIDNPEAYISIISSVLLSLNVWATYFFGKKVRDASGSILSALICQTAPLIFFITVVRVVYLAPEALLVFSSMVLLGLLAPVFFSFDKKQNPIAEVSPALVGIVCGLGLAVKVTFLPMLFLLFLLGSRKRVLMGAFYTALGFLFFVSPALSHADKFYAWIIQIIMGSGMYGTGTDKFVDFGSIPKRIFDLLRMFPIFYLATFLMLISVINKFFRKESESKINYVIPLVLLAISFVETILVLKHYSPHYMIAVLPVCVVGLAWFVRSGVVSNFNGSSKIRMLSVILAALVVFSIKSASFNIKAINSDRSEQINAMNIIEPEIAKYPDAVLLGTYRCTLPECAFLYSAEYSKSINWRLSSFFTNHVWLNIGNNKINTFEGGRKEISSLNQYLDAGRVVLLLSREYPSLKLLNIEPLVITEGQSLYRVTGIAHN